MFIDYLIATDFQKKNFVCFWQCISILETK